MPSKFVINRTYSISNVLSVEKSRFRVVYLMMFGLTFRQKRRIVRSSPTVNVSANIEQLEKGDKQHNTQ